MIRRPAAFAGARYHDDESGPQAVGIRSTACRRLPEVFRPCPC